MTQDLNNRVLGHIGLGLSSMRSMALHPRNRVSDCRALGEYAVLAEQLGFHSIWTAEHRIWYDAWTPAPLHALAPVAGRTSRLRMGTAVLLATQHDPFTLAGTAATLDRCSGGRLDLGVLDIMPAAWAAAAPPEPGSNANCAVPMAVRPLAPCAVSYLPPKARILSSSRFRAQRD